MEFVPSDSSKFEYTPTTFLTHENLIKAHHYFSVIIKVRYCRGYGLKIIPDEIVACRLASEREQAISAWLAVVFLADEIMGVLKKKVGIIDSPEEENSNRSQLRGSSQE